MPPTKKAHQVKAIIHIMPKQDVLDPQGRAIAQSLKEQGFHVLDARCGKRLELVCDVDPTLSRQKQEEQCHTMCRAMCSAMLVNELVEHYHIDIDHA
ncbi:MAG: phosphoribosylformylglycinamidine synthase subunit PurS [Alphaproteobacteria bacterium GM7ARS4]|nr:phosphoribosylformylglycinamidine synthase subunit PurS [Alphaproteobacteria bacterium GM7ARS4]